MAITIGALAYQISADSSKFTKGIVLTRKELRSARKVMEDSKSPAEKLGDRIDELDRLHKSGAITQRAYNKALGDAKMKFGGATQSAGKFRGALSSMLARVKSINPAMVAAGVGVAGLAVGLGTAAFAVRKLTQAAKAQAPEIDRIAKFAANVGFSTERVIALESAAASTGAEVGNITRAITKSQKRIADAAKGNQAYTKALMAIGLTAEELLRMRPERMFDELLDGINRLRGAQRINIAAKLLGIGQMAKLQGLIAMTSEGVDQLQRDLAGLNFTFAREEAARVENLNGSLQMLDEAYKAIGRTVAIEFAPVIDAGARTLIDFVKEANKTGLLKDTFIGLADITVESFALIISATGPLLTTFSALRSTVISAGAGVASLNLAWKQLMGTATNVDEAFTNTFLEQAANAELASLKVQKLADGADAAAANFRSLVFQLRNATVAESALAGGGGGPGGSSPLVRPIQSVVESLKQQIQTFGMSANAIQLRTVAIGGASRAELAHVAALQQVLAQRKANMQAAEEAKQRQQQQQEAFKRTTQGIRENIIALRFGAKALEVFKLKQAGLSNQQIAFIGRLKQVEQRLKDQQAAQEQLAKNRKTIQQIVEDADKTSQDVVSQIFGKTPTGSIKRGTEAAARLEFRQRNPELLKQIRESVKRRQVLMEIRDAIKQGEIVKVARI